MDFNHEFPSRRSNALGRHGAVAASTQPAALAGYDVLKAGGNAADAAIARAAALVVTEPTSNGLGSDLFAIIWDGHKLHGLNASGRSPKALSSGLLRQKGHAKMPLIGWEPVTIPGMVMGWADINKKFGRMRLEDVLEPAAVLAEKGFPVSQIVAHYWGFASGRCGQMSRSLRDIAASSGECFYRGHLADAIVQASDSGGGYFCKEDFSSHSSEWVDPISTNYRGYDVCEIPPNGQGIVALMALNILERYDMSEFASDSPKRANLIAEALRLSFSDAYSRICDTSFMKVPVERMLSKGYAAERASLIEPGTAMEEARTGLPYKGGTVYLCAADNDGMMVSLIQSNYMGFGSGIVIPEHGISLQNRGAGFSLEQGHPNELMPCKRPFHTIIPGFLMKDGMPVGPFGVMGGDMQPQGHAQLVSGIVDLGLSPQAGIDMPRLRIGEGKKLHLEKGLSHIVEAISGMGYDAVVESANAMFGGGQMIIRDPESGVYIAGTESRKDGIAIAY
jgi:gamma-glutamyltranspeptidase/glutathione hydrolase